MLLALAYGLGTAVPLVLGAAVGLYWKLPRAVLASLMAFGSGTMVAAVSEELFEPAFRGVGAARAGTALLIGACVYVVANRLLDAKLGTAAIGWSLMLGTLLDGVPENTALGVSLSEVGGVALLVAIAVGNTPEAIGGAAKMREQPGLGRAKALGVWAATGALLVAVTVASQAASDDLSAQTIGTVQAAAGGATIAVLADTLMPEAYREGGWWVGIATALGFFVAFLLG